MPTKSKGKRVILIGGLLFVLLLLPTAFFFSAMWYEESLGNIKRPWKVEKVVKKKKIINQSFRRMSFILLDAPKMRLPLLKKTKPQYPSVYGRWQYKRKGLFDGQLTIKDIEQSFFDGVYDIEFIKYSQPVVMRLYSDSIEIYLKEKYFSLDKPFIELDFETKSNRPDSDFKDKE